MSKRLKKSIYDNKRLINTEEMDKYKREYILRSELGLVYNYDSIAEINNDKFKSISSVYKSLTEYEHDKIIASKLIENNENIPNELYTRLLKTKKELEKAGITVSM